MAGLLVIKLNSLLMLLLITTNWVSLVSTHHEACEKLNNVLDSTERDIFNTFEGFVARYVNPENGSNTNACLNYDNTTTPPPCMSLQYAIQGEENVTLSNNNVVIYLAPGTYNLTSYTSVVNSERVAIIGSGFDVTFGNCGQFGEEDQVCDFMNFQIKNSSYVYVYGITFTRCGPITSPVYIAVSDYVFFKNCSFSDNISPPVLVYDTPTVMFTNTTFKNNRPANLPSEVVHNTCYFSGGQEFFFLDNRTTSGAISFYIENWPTNFLISGCTFTNNSARPDNDVSIARLSSAYGHGGAVNIRFLHSSNSLVCIENSLFKDNFAEAHAGALAISLAGLSTNNKFIFADCDFNSNKCEIDKCTGGAVGIDFFSNTENNTLVFTDTNFTGNVATSSGAISLSTFVSAISDILILERCWFQENQAFFEGTAFGAFSLTHANQIGVPIECYDCHFHNNKATGGSIDTTAVTAYRVLISFYGNNTFYNNFGGGLSLLSSRMDVRGHVTFDGNTAVFGGGIAMSGRSLVLLYENSSLDLLNNKVSELGAGIYVESASRDFVLSVLNTGCFIRYFSNLVGVEPTEWKTKVRFINNIAGLAGAAIYANDMSRCRWVGSLNITDIVIFEITEELGSPFYFENNNVTTSDPDTIDRTITNVDFATDASNLTAQTTFNSSSSVSFGERVSIRLTSLDQLDNFREAVWSVNAPLELQPLGSLSSNGSIFVYDVPGKQDLEEGTEIDIVNGSALITAEFAFLQSQVTKYPVNLILSASCHPGYVFDNTSQICVCLSQLNRIVRCDTSNRYFYAQDGFWVGVEDDNYSLYFANTIPGFLNCTRQGALQGCLFKYDQPDLQCASGRQGVLCGDCQEGYAPTFDLRFCRNDCGPWGIILFIAICISTFVLSLLVLYFDFPLPNELKGVIFFAQVIGVVYRNTPYLLRTGENEVAFMFFDFLINFLGFAMPFSLCLSPSVPAYAIGLLGYIPPLIALVTAFTYTFCANRVNFLGHREKYGFHGFYFLLLFIYKYILDTSFIFISCTFLEGEGEYVFLFQGSLKCFDVPFIFLFILGAILVVGLGIALPIYALVLIYRPKKMILVANSLTHGLKQSKRYLWYGVWDIWRRLLFVVANLFISVATRSVVLFIHCMFILLCLGVICTVKPYKKYHINVMEVLVTLCLFGATLALLDENDIYVGPNSSVAFIAFPFMYAVVFITYRGVRRFGEMCWTKSNKRWDVQESQVNKRIVENYKKIGKYVGERKEKIALIFMDPTEERVSQNWLSGSKDTKRTSETGQTPGDSSTAEGTPNLNTDLEETCTLREPLLEEL